MAEIRRCVTCKHKNVDVDEEPCVICKKLCPTAIKDMYEPMEERTEKLTKISIGEHIQHMRYSILKRTSLNVKSMKR